MVGATGGERGRGEGVGVCGWATRLALYSFSSLLKINTMKFTIYKKDSILLFLLLGFVAVTV